MSGIRLVDSARKRQETAMPVVVAISNKPEMVSEGPLQIFSLNEYYLAPLPICC